MQHAQPIAEIVIPRNATARPVRAIYSETASNMLSEMGQTNLRRASHVEPSAELTDAAVLCLMQNAIDPCVQPDADQLSRFRNALAASLWWADMLPSGGPVLGPFNKRDDAINAELVWLKERGLPVCEDCVRSPLAIPKETSRYSSEEPNEANVSKARKPNYNNFRTAIQVPPGIQIQLPRTPVLLENGDMLDRHDNGVISRLRNGFEIERRDASTPGYQD